MRKSYIKTLITKDGTILLPGFYEKVRIFKTAQAMEEFASNWCDKSFRHYARQHAMQDGTFLVVYAILSHGR